MAPKGFDQCCDADCSIRCSAHSKAFSNFADCAVNSLVRPSICCPLTQHLKAVYDTYLEIDTDEFLTKWIDKFASKLSIFMLNWRSSSWNVAPAVKWSEDKGLPLKKDAAVIFQDSNHMKGLILRNWQHDTGVWLQLPTCGKQFGWKWTYGDRELNSVWWIGLKDNLAERSIWDKGRIGW